LVEYLISTSVDVNEKPAETEGVTALQAAAIRGHMEIALKLLDAGANVNTPAAESNGRTAIEGAAEHGRLDMVKLLINTISLSTIARFSIVLQGLFASRQP